MSDAPAAVVVLISGRGTNLRAILDATDRGQLAIVVRAVISNNPQAEGLRYARTAGIATEVIDHRDYAERAEFDRALMRAIDRYQPRLVALAGFMRILGAEFIRHYAGRLMNVHPSLLPEFKGLNTHARALQAGATEHGASIHFVTNDLDGGPAIVQARIGVRPDDSVDTLAARVLEQEHRIYPLAIGWFVANRLTLRDGRVLLDGAVRPEQGFDSPGARRPA
jgi:phosphoribosylglycinamide formyltransferase-1